MKKTIICDLDGTLFNINHRLHYLEEKNWDAFFAAVPRDTPHEWCVRLLDAMDVAGYEIVFVSGRNESARPATEEWLEKLGFDNCELYMRPANSRDPDYILKERMFDQHLKERDILFVLEDRSQVVKMWRKRGLLVHQCHEG